MIQPLLIITSEIEIFKIKKILKLYQNPKKVALINLSSLTLDNNEIKQYLNNDIDLKILFHHQNLVSVN